MIKENQRLEDLDPIQQSLLIDAHDAAQHAYAKYSLYHVGAAILTNQDTRYKGVNVENSSFPLGSCAEQNAFGAMVMGGESKGLRMIAIIGYHSGIGQTNDTLLPISPCGGCRQSIIQFATEAGFDTDVIMSNPDMTSITVAKISDLLPLDFVF